MLIYLDGPLTGNEEANTRAAVVTAERLRKRGHFAYIPHLSNYQNQILQQLGYAPTYDQWLELDFEMIKRCDAMLFMDASPGAERERDYARKIGKPIFCNIEDLPANKEGL